MRKYTEHAFPSAWQRAKAQEVAIFVRKLFLGSAPLRAWGRIQEMKAHSCFSGEGGPSPGKSSTAKQWVTRCKTQPEGSKAIYNSIALEATQTPSRPVMTKQRLKRRNPTTRCRAAGDGQRAADVHTWRGASERSVSRRKSQGGVCTPFAVMAKQMSSPPRRSRGTRRGGSSLKRSSGIFFSPNKLLKDRLFRTDHGAPGKVRGRSERE